ncbi:hypothetical protein AUC71_13570 [Methyloceanibacter marginalis]|uniref:Uncharacterized protein n=1 Tax=Methyloceanibacter marginalis TaxID=1774971 RepID=A0A1E3WCG9_9HYPH|nr:hypothetical protein [Methyloceanibacter marginalis]ODS02757.1 hypothetical protein AUC71_13570 [Methyloceanibacter marginalis]
MTIDQREAVPSGNRGTAMTKRCAGLTLVTLTICLGSFVAPAYAQEGSGQAAGAPAAASGDTKKEESFLEKLEEDLKETTTPTDEESDPIGTAEDVDRDLY